jgi:predicted  nucleic acid-binding Zn-ribbon protein
MIKDLENLIKLQEIDLKIREQEEAKRQYPADAAGLEAQISEKAAAVTTAENRLAQLASGVAAADEQAAKLRESLNKSQERLSSIQTNREYDAVHKEIEAQKAMLASSESRKAALEADIEAGKTALEGARAALESIKAELRPQIDDLNAKISAIDSVIAGIAAERDTVSPAVSLPTLRTYDSIRKKRKSGKAISQVNPEDRTCGVCSIVLQPQFCNEIRHGNKILLCENCGSILVWV